MNMREIGEVARIEAGETLVMIPKREITTYQVTRLSEAAERVGVKLLILPRDAKIYVQSAS